MKKKSRRNGSHGKRNKKTRRLASSPPAALRIEALE